MHPLEDSTVNRRTSILIVTLALGILMAPVVADAQPPGTMWRIGYLSPYPPASPIDVARFEAFRRGLLEFGYVEGQNLSIEYRSSEGKDHQFFDLAAELVRLKVDVIVTGGSTPATVAAKNVTKTIPIVFGVAADPVGTGLVASLARPGGNVTGLSLLSPELGGKRLEILKEAGLPLSRVAVLFNPANPAFEPQWSEMSAAGVALGIQLQPVAVRDPTEFEDKFRAMINKRVTALIVLQDPLFISQRQQLVELAARSRLPMLSPWREIAEAGGFMSYGANPSDLFRRAAGYVDKILKGAKPADLPVEQPIKFELVVNLKTAKELGLTIPPSLLFQADEVIR
jgi:putative ABC transport system substrate-binding protein